MVDGRIIIAFVILLLVFICIKMRKKYSDNFKNTKKPYKNKKKRMSKNGQGGDDLDGIATKVYEEFHELFMEEEEIDEDDLQEIDDRIDDIILIEFTQLYNNKDHEKIKVRDYKKILKKNLNSS